MTIKKISLNFYLLSFLLPLAMPQQAEAQIPMIAFKNITRHFKPGLEYNSPTYGKAALRYIKNLRFNGNVIPGMKTIPDTQKQERKYIEDKGKDPIAQLMVTLFPSPAGDFTVETTGDYNFGKYAQPESVALFLNFAHKVRKGEKFSDEQLSEYSQEIVKTYASNMMQGARGKKLKILGQEVRNILKSISSSITDTDKLDSPYPQYMPEFVLNAFFCEKFNEQDIETLLKALDPEMLNPNIPFTLDSWTKEDLKKIAQKKAPDADELLILNNSDIFDRITPYETPTSIIYNGNAAPFNPDRSEFEYKPGNCFGDCVENAIRTTLNLLAYSSDTYTFNFGNKVQPNHPYFMKVSKFYERQTPERVTDGEITTRSLWASRLANLNSDGKTPQVRYGKSKLFERGLYEYELRSGYINFVNTLYKLFGLEPTILPSKEDPQARRNWVVKELQDLFTIINPNRDYKVDFKDNMKSLNEIDGVISVLVKDKFSGNDMFSFSLISTSRNKHFGVQTLDIFPTQKKDQDYSQELETFFSTSRKEKNETYQDLIWSCNKNFISKLPLFHQVFADPLSDKDSCVKALKTICQESRTLFETVDKASFWSCVGQNIWSNMPLKYIDERGLLSSNPSNLFWRESGEFKLDLAEVMITSQKPVDDRGWLFRVEHKETKELLGCMFLNKRSDPSDILDEM